MGYHTGSPPLSLSLASISETKVVLYLGQHHHNHHRDHLHDYQHDHATTTPHYNDHHITRTTVCAGRSVSWAKMATVKVQIQCIMFICIIWFFEAKYSLFRNTWSNYLFFVLCFLVFVFFVLRLFWSIFQLLLGGHSMPDLVAHIGLLLFSVRRLFFSFTLFTSSLSLRRHLLTSVILSHCRHHQEQRVTSSNFTSSVTFSIPSISSMTFLPCHGQATLQATTTNELMDDHPHKCIYRHGDDITSPSIHRHACACIVIITAYNYSRQSLIGVPDGCAGTPSIEVSA